MVLWSLMGWGQHHYFNGQYVISISVIRSSPTKGSMFLPTYRHTYTDSYWNLQTKTKLNKTIAFIIYHFLWCFVGRLKSHSISLYPNQGFQKPYNPSTYILYLYNVHPMFSLYANLCCRSQSSYQYKLSRLLSLNWMNLFYK